MKTLLQNNALELGKGNIWQFTVTFYSSEIHSSTIFLRLGFSIAAAILSLSLICLLTEKEHNRNQEYELKKGIILDIVHSCSCDLITILGDPGADSGDEEKSKRAEKYMPYIFPPV